MLRTSRIMRGLLAASLALTVGSGAAFADEEPAGGAAEGGAEGGMEGGAEGGAEGGEAMPAETPPAVEEPAPAPAPGPAGMTLPKGKIKVDLTFEANMSKDFSMKPFSVAPDIYYGVMPGLQVGLVHSLAAYNGFRGGSGFGLCLAGEDNRCDTVYKNVGIEALYDLVKGPFAAAANVGVHTRFAKIMDESKMGIKIKVGAKTRYTAGKVTVNVNPAVLFSATERDLPVGHDELWVPVAVGAKVMPQLAVGLGGGLKVPSLSEPGIGDTWHLAAGLWANFEVNKQLNAGASFIFGNLAGGEIIHPDGMGAADDRHLQIWVGYKI